MFVTARPSSAPPQLPCCLIGTGPLLSHDPVRHLRGAIRAERKVPHGHRRRHKAALVLLDLSFRDLYLHPQLPSPTNGASPPYYEPVDTGLPDSERKASTFERIRNRIDSAITNRYPSIKRGTSLVVTANAANTVTVSFYNPMTAAVDLGSGTLHARIWKLQNAKKQTQILDVLHMRVMKL